MNIRLHGITSNKYKDEQLDTDDFKAIHIQNCVNYISGVSFVLQPKIQYQFDVRGSVQHSTIHKEKPNTMQQCIKILLFHIYMKLNMFRATHRPSSGA